MCNQQLSYTQIQPASQMKIRATPNGRDSRSGQRRPTSPPYLISFTLMHNSESAFSIHNTVRRKLKFAKRNQSGKLQLLLESY